jgi:excisionase family DNA binding protein
MKALAEYPDVLTVPEVMALTRLGRNTVYESIGRGEIPHVKFGRRILIPKAALSKLLETGNLGKAAA